MDGRFRAGLGIVAAGAVVLWTACQVRDSRPGSSFDLQGAHTELTCSDCHGADLDEAPASRCSGCHERPVVHWDDECDGCHSQDRWDDLTYEHDEWALTGVHRETPCEDCHLDGSFDAETSCQVCHVEDKPVGHIDSDCWHCHGTDDWDPLFAHADFPLIGGHSGVACLSCHADGLDDTPHECKACHIDDMPHYGEHNEPFDDCDDCHTVYHW